MRKIAILTTLLLVAATSSAQEQTPQPVKKARSYFGAPVIKYTVISKQAAVMAGGRGGWNLNPSLVVGFGAYGTMRGVDLRVPTVPGASGPLDIKFETFGLELEYSPHPAARTRLTLGSFFGGGASHYVRNGTTEQHGETDFMLVLEPAVGVQQRVTDWLHLNLALAYRLVGGAEQPGMEARDLNGPVASLAVKLGRF